MNAYIKTTTHAWFSFETALRKGSSVAAKKPAARQRRE
jgi:hypothetical protein